jgi:AraC-like DNA-binding protein
MLTEEPERDIGLPELAECCGAEMYALHRAFTRVVGLPPHAFQTHQRLRRAKALLRAGASLTDAALAAGFCDQSHMHRHFTRLVGFTPAQYASAHMARRAR